MFDLSEKTNNNDLNAKLLNDRLIRSVSEVIQREVEEYLSERLKDYSLYKDAYEQIMTISTTNNSSSPTCFPFSCFSFFLLAFCFVFNGRLLLSLFISQADSRSLLLAAFGGL